MYSEEYVGQALVPSSSAPLTAGSLTATGDYALWYAGEQFVLTRIMFLVSTAVVATTTAPVVTVYARPTFGSTTGQITIGTLTMPNGTAAGTILYKNVESVKIPQGYTLAYNVSTAAVGSPAGAGFALFKGFVAVEDPKNVSAMVASA